MTDKMKARKVKKTINQVYATVGFAMGIAVIVLSIIDPDIAKGNLITMLGIAVTVLGLFALNSLPISDKDAKELNAHISELEQIISKKKE